MFIIQQNDDCCKARAEKGRCGRAKKAWGRLKADKYDDKMTHIRLEEDGRLEEMRRVERAICALRTGPGQNEMQLHAQVARALAEAGLEAEHEANLGGGRRIDFLCGGVGVEVKRGKPVRGALLRQLARYAQSDAIRGIVLVVERSAHLPATVGGKPVRVVSLNRQWGISLP